MFKPLENNRPFAKVAFEGFAGDGKSYTATKLAIGIHQLIGSEKPIAIFDTEKAFKALKREFDIAGIAALCDDDNRSLAGLSNAIKFCEEGNADILIIDSITHVWESFIQSYMQEKKKSRLEFQDWGIIKPKWKSEFSTPFVQAKCHIIFTGRAGYEYENEVNSDTGKREIFKSGIKMKAENETAFEPDLLILMEKKMDILSDKKNISREATVLKDRTTMIDGKSFTNPTFDDFYPAIKELLNGVLKESSNGHPIPDTFEDWEEKFGQMNRKRNNLIAEIEGLFSLMGLGSSVDHKKMKAAILKRAYGVVSIDALSAIPLNLLAAGFDKLKQFEDKYSAYMKECLELQTSPDNEQIGRILSSVLNPDPQLSLS